MEEIGCALRAVKDGLGTPYQEKRVEIIDNADPALTPSWYPALLLHQFTNRWPV